MLQLPIKTVKIMINTKGCDYVFLTPDTPTPFPIMNYPPNVKMEVQAGYGIEWCRLVFNREPDEIIDLKHKY